MKSIKNMKKGFTTFNMIMALSIGMVVVGILNDSVSTLKRLSHKQYNQDLISSLQLYQIFNASKHALIQDKEISFQYLNENKTLRYVNGKIVMSPGTVVYYTDVSDYNFEQEEFRIYLTLKRNKMTRKFLIGELCDMASS